MSKGHRFELTLKNEIDEKTQHWAKAHRPDFSGNSTGEVADLMVVWQAERYSDQRPSGHPERHVAYVEAKKRSAKGGNRSTVMKGSSDEQSGLEELEELLQETPDWTRRYVAIKFNNRELIVLSAKVLMHWLQREQEGWGQEWLTDAPGKTPWSKKKYQLAEDLGARLTPSDNISMVKPELSDWPSSKAGQPDWKKLALRIGLEEYDFK